MNRSRWLCPAGIAPDGRVASGGMRLLVALMCLAVFLCSPAGEAAGDTELQGYCMEQVFRNSIQYGEKGETFEGIYTYPKTGHYLFPIMNYELISKTISCGGDILWSNMEYCSEDSTPGTMYFGSSGPWTLAGTTDEYAVTVERDYPRTCYNSYEIDGWIYNYSYTMAAYYYGTLCGAEIDNVPTLIKQTNPAWKDLKYDSTDKTIRQRGCAMSSLTMLMNSEGCNKSILDINNCKDCFVGNGLVSWGDVLEKYCTGTRHVDRIDYKQPVSVENILKNESISEDIENEYKYILRVTGSTGQCGHFVFMTGVSDDCNSFNVLDPAGRVSSVSKICGYRKFK